MEIWGVLPSCCELGDGFFPPKTNPTNGEVKGQNKEEHLPPSYSHHLDFVVCLWMMFRV